MKIKRISTAIVDIPLKRPHKMSLFSLEKVNIVIVIIQSDNGLEGFGEAVALGGPTWSEESAESIIAVINKYLAPYLIGQNPEQFEKIRSLMEQLVRGNHFAKCAVEMALYDLIGKQRDLPVFDLLGGKVYDKIPLSWSLASSDVDEEIKEAEKMLKNGISIIKLKVGALSPEEDVERIRIIREAVGKNIKLRVDANQGWNKSVAIRTAKKMEEYNLEFCEQPLPRWDIDGMEAVAKSISIPVMADESLASEYDALQLVYKQAASIFGIKLTKAGGFLGGKRLAAIAESAGLQCYIGCMIESGIGTSAYLHFAVSTPPVKMGCELFGPILLADDIVNEETVYEQGNIVVNSRPGLGVTIDEKRLNKYIRDKFNHVEE